MSSPLCPSLWFSLPMSSLAMSSRVFFACPSMSSPANTVHPYMCTIRNYEILEKIVRRSYNVTVVKNWMYTSTRILFKDSTISGLLLHIEITPTFVARYQLEYSAFPYDRPVFFASYTSYRQNSKAFNKLLVSHTWTLKAKTGLYTVIS